MKKPRKKYRPRPVRLNALEMAVNNVRRLSAEDVEKHQALVALSLREFSSGQHCDFYWNSLADTCNFCAMLAKLNIGAGQDAARVIETAKLALAAVKDRSETRGTWTLYPAELEALQWLVILHGVQLEACDYGEFDRAFRMTCEMGAQALAGNAPAGVPVLVGQMRDRTAV